jgi:UDP-N-acetyl-D-mannosaminuronate dehydrogenase
VKKNEQVLVVGLGEVGRPLLELVSEHYRAVGLDLEPPRRRLENVDVLHICYPFAIKDFVGETARYIELFKPALTIINSTVAVGTTRAIAQRTGTALVSSPVRGKHARMLEDLRHYVKFIGPMEPASGTKAASHFQLLGLKTKLLSSPEATELAKLTETTYYGLLIAWAQEVERYSDHWNQNYAEVASFWEEVKYLPPVNFFPGIIGGHCVMPNIEILSNCHHSSMLRAIQDSNQMKKKREDNTQLKHSAARDTHVPVEDTELASL